MIKKKVASGIAKLMTIAMCVSAVASPLIACNNQKLSNEETPLVLATDILDGVFNPFFYTSGSDGEVVSQTQIGMLSSDENGEIVSGWDEPCVALDHSVVQHGSLAENGSDYTRFYTDYYLALKDDIKFSDGTLLTKDDVLFNIYMYLDPAYTGSSTMYSVKIQGLPQYRTQRNTEGGGEEDDKFFDSETETRINAILDWANTDDYPDNTWADLSNYEYHKQAELNKGESIQKDILQAHEFFKEEVESDWNSAMAVEPEKDYEKYKGLDGKLLITENWQVFLYNYGIIDLKRQPKPGNTSEYYYTLDNQYPASGKTDKETLTKYVFDSKLGNHEAASETYRKSLSQVLSYYATASSFFTYMRSKVIEATLVSEDGTLNVPTVTGIEILEDQASIPTNATGDKRDLENKDGDKARFDVLHIKIDGVDPKAIQNFAFTVAPGHHYSRTWQRAQTDPEYFGVEFASADFMNYVKSNQVPLGAGPYMASRESGGANTNNKSAFYNNNSVYLERNPNFLLGAPKIKKLRFKVIANNMLYEAVKTREVHYSSPSMDRDNIQKLSTEDKDTIAFASSDNLGYGYIGISARYIPNIWIRRAIMTTLNSQACVNYYGGERYAQRIYRPMSRTMTKYYPLTAGEYYPYDESGDTALQYALKGGCTSGRDGLVDDKGNKLKYTFTVAGDSDDHPANGLLINSAEILNKIGFEITVTHDSTALSKLANGQLTVWAAAWSSSSDPDMYQVYHKNSSATSTLAWGYTYLKSQQAVIDNYDDQVGILDLLTEKIEQGRETIVEAERKNIYSNTGSGYSEGANREDLCALDLLMELAVEFPTYQRQVYYVWRKGVFDESTMYTTETGDRRVTSYRSPLNEIWNVSFNEG